MSGQIGSRQNEGLRGKILRILDQSSLKVTFNAKTKRAQVIFIRLLR